MSFTVENLLRTIRDSRAHFLRHMSGVREDQWDWKPYPECRSIRETVAHLISDDRASVFTLEKGGFPDFEACRETETDASRLMALLVESHERLCETIARKFLDASLDTEIPFWFGPTALGSALIALTSEDHYHAGQVAYIRLATDPEWDYYGTVYPSDAP